MDEDDARLRFAAAPLGHLATVDTQGRPSVVPFCFAVVGDQLYTAVDSKPKSTTQLARVTHITERPGVTVLVDHYEDDWTRLWWVRVRGQARLADSADRQAGVAALRRKYPQYIDHALDGPVIAVSLDTWRWWSAS